MRTWLPEDDAVILRMLSDGQTRSQISAHFGVTRNAICGKVHRLNQLSSAPMKPNDETIAALEELDAGGGEIHDGATEDKFNEIMAYEPPLLPPPELYISKEADQLDQHQLKETGKRYHWKSRNCHVGSYVSMIGLCASTLGKITSVDQIQNRATVDWIIFDLDHWRRYPVSSLCRWSDLYAADALMIERVAPPR